MNKSIKSTGNTSLPDKIYSTLLERILNFSLMPGQLLTAQQFAQEFKTSRTPVREALLRLCDENLVCRTTGSKFRVTELSWKYIFDLYEMRESLELLALKGIAGNVTQKGIRQLNEIVNVMEKQLEKKNYKAFFDNDMNFHATIISLYGNQLILNWMNSIRNQQQRIRYLTIGLNNRLNITIKEHRKIIQDLENGLTEEAMNDLRSHLHSTVSDFKAVKEDPSNPMNLFIK